MLAAKKLFSDNFAALKMFEYSIQIVSHCFPKWLNASQETDFNKRSTIIWCNHA